MVIRNVFQVLKLHSPAARAILSSWKTSLVLIYIKKCTRARTIFCTNCSSSYVTRVLSAWQERDCFSIVKGPYALGEYNLTIRGYVHEVNVVFVLYTWRVQQNHGRSRSSFTLFWGGGGGGPCAKAEGGCIFHTLTSSHPSNSLMGILWLD